ncbi:MAG: cellulase family glycosylhydrolase [Anaerolineae bacterium]|nr:cellulase family glycosylhydrolase [Anaerolineae bacterium]
MITFHRLTLCIVIFSLISLLFPALAPTHDAAAQSGVSDARYARLARGVNLAFWFWRGPADLTAVETYYSDADFALLRGLGLTFVRLPVSMDFLFDVDNPAQLRPGALAVFDRALDRILAHDLAVVIDIHSTVPTGVQSDTYSMRLENDPAFVDGFVAFWSLLAAHLSVRSPDSVFLELLNEPVFDSDPGQWVPIQNRLIAAIRQHAPDHTLIVTSAGWALIDTFIQMLPVDDPNVIYTFHFFEPMLFTRQGAAWVWDKLAELQGIPYPSSPENITPLLDQITDEDMRGYLAIYGEEQWNASRIEARIALVAAWANQHGVRVLCGEFGAFAAFAPPPDRAQYLADVRIALEMAGIGWALWEYDQTFGMVTRENGSTHVDTVIAHALGLSMQSP